MYASRSYQRTGRVIAKQVANNINTCEAFRLLCVTAHKIFQVSGRFANCRCAPSYLGLRSPRNGQNLPTVAGCVSFHTHTHTRARARQDVFLG